MTKAYHSTNGRMDHETPPALYWVLWKLRQYNLDVGASAETAKAANYYGLDNGRDTFTRPWRGRWFCNPEYGRTGEIAKWLAYGESQIDLLGPESKGSFLIPARVGTAWYWAHVRHWEQWILPGRLTFWVHGRPLDGSAGFPSVVVHMGLMFKTGSVKFWDWRDELEELVDGHKGMEIPEGLRPSQYDHLELIDGRWEYIEPWNRAEAAVLLKPGQYPEVYADLVESKGRTRDQRGLC